MHVYYLQDIPNTMLMAIENIAKKNDRALIYVTGSENIWEEIRNIVVGSEIQVVFFKDGEKLERII